MCSIIISSILDSISKLFTELIFYSFGINGSTEANVVKQQFYWLSVRLPKSISIMPLDILCVSSREINKAVSLSKYPVKRSPNSPPCHIQEAALI